MNLTKISDYTDKDYASFWRSSERRYFDELERTILNKLLPKKGKWFIDLGCGFGRFKDLYLMKYENVVMLDYSSHLINQAMESIKCQNKSNIYFVLADMYNLPFRVHSFDVSLLARVFHHLESPNLAFEQIRRVLITNGTLIFNFYNKRNIREMTKYFINRSGINPFEVDHINLSDTDLLYYSHPLFVKTLLQRLEFQIIKEMGGGLFYGEVFSHIYRPVFLEKQFLQILGKYYLSMSIYLKTILQKKAEDQSFEDHIPSHLNDILSCPACKNATLIESRQLISCRKCDASFPIKEGIYDFRIQNQL